MKTYLPIAVAVVVMLAAGYVQGVWSERWGEFPELQAFKDQLPEIPKEVGEWKGEDSEASDERTLKVAGAEGELVRTYKNAQGDVVRVSIICGRLQDITYHTPDRCYPAAGFEMQGDPISDSIECGDRTAEFLTTTFQKSEPTGTHTERGYWSWSGDGTWKTPSNPKFEFARYQHALYKMYVFGSIAPGKHKAGEQDFCREFIRVFVPRVESALRPAMVKAGRVEPDAVAPPVTENAG
jgi:EpsI family protein